jgi:hypothetical protein
MKKKTLLIIDNQKYIFAGVMVVVDYNGKSLCFQLYLGNIILLMPAQNSEIQWMFLIPPKRFGLKPYDDKICKMMQKLENIKTS